MSEHWGPGIASLPLICVRCQLRPIKGRCPRVESPCTDFGALDAIEQPSAPHRIVSAAMLMDDDLIVPGVRHFSPDMRAVLNRVYGKGYHLRVREQGFVDTHGQFLSREDAYRRAVANNQIRKQVGKPGTLYSENLY